MALKNDKGNYMRIRSASALASDTVTRITGSYQIWESEPIRQAPSDFNKPKEGSFVIDDLTELQPTADNLYDSIMQVSYNELKKGEFDAWIDC
jgi:hypothetical protein